MKSGLFKALAYAQVEMLYICRFCNCVSLFVAVSVEENAWLHCAKEGIRKETREFGTFIIFIIEYARVLHFSFSVAGYNGWL